METSASFEARYAPLSYPTAGGDQRWSSLPQPLEIGIAKNRGACWVASSPLLKMSAAITGPQ